MHQKTVLPFSEVAESLSYPTVAAAYIARARGIFPVRVRQLGSKLVCFQSDVEAYLRTGESQAHLSVCTSKKKARVKVGRPTKPESIKAASLGLSVRELRAQSVAGV